MCKKLMLLTLFVAVFGLASVAVAEDLEPPWFAGQSGWGATVWEFDIDPVVGEELYDPEGEGPSDWLYDPELEEYAFSVWPSYGDVTWDEEGQMLVVTPDDETAFYMATPDGEGPYLTLYVQVTRTEGEVWPMLEMWTTPSREGEYLGGMEGDALDYWGDPVEVEPGVVHQVFYHTFEPDEIPPYVNLLIWWEECEVYEVILDAIVHSDPEAPAGSGARPGVPPDPNLASNPVPENGASEVDATIASLTWDDCNLVLHPDPNYDVFFGTDPCSANNPNTVVDSNLFPVSLDWGTTYYWRVDTIGSDGTHYINTDWSFTTGGLLAWWKLDETEGETVANAAGNEMNGTLVGDPQWQPDDGKVGGALLFDGEGDYVNCGKDPAFNITDEMTIAAWIKVNEFDKGWQSIVTKGDSAWRIARETDKNTLQFGMGLYGRDLQAVRGTIDVNDGSWHHVAGVYDGRRLYLYVDGHLDETTFGSGKIPGNDYAVAIGQNTERPDRDWNGWIDDVRLYSCALTKPQIGALAAGEEPTVATAPVTLLQQRDEQIDRQLMAWWKFDEAEGELARDSVGDHDGKDPIAVAGPVSPPEEAPPAQVTVPTMALAAQPPAPPAEQPSETVAEQSPAGSDAPAPAQAQGTRKTNLVVVFAIALAVVAIVGASVLGRKPAT